MWFLKLQFGCFEGDYCVQCFYWQAITVLEECGSSKICGSDDACRSNFFSRYNHKRILRVRLTKEVCLYNCIITSLLIGCFCSYVILRCGWWDVEKAGVIMISKLSIVNRFLTSYFITPSIYEIIITNYPNNFYY